MASADPDVVVRVARDGDDGAVAALRALWSAGAEPDPEFEARIASWLALEGSRRTTWLAEVDGAPVGMASLFE